MKTTSSTYHFASGRCSAGYPVAPTSDNPVTYVFE